MRQEGIVTVHSIHSPYCLLSATIIMSTMTVGFWLVANNSRCVPDVVALTTLKIVWLKSNLMPITLIYL
jgi:hypothetical protein